MYINPRVYRSSKISDAHLSTSPKPAIIELLLTVYLHPIYTLLSVDIILLSIPVQVRTRMKHSTYENNEKVLIIFLDRS